MSTFQQQTKVSGREPVFVVRFSIPRCSLTFGVGDCTATTDNPNKKCFQTWTTCLARDSYANASINSLLITLASRRIDTDASDLTSAFPVLDSVITTPTSLNVAKGFSSRETCDIKFRDFPATDTYIDKYIADRTYSAFDNGTFFAKLKARFPYFENVKIFVYTGYLHENNTFDFLNAKVREYVIDRVDGPDSKGNVLIRCKDPLALAYNSKVNVPSVSKITLVNDIDEIQTVFEIDDQTSSIPAIGNYYRIDDEIMQITNWNDLTSEVTVQRAKMPPWYRTTSMLPDSHDQGTHIQECKEFNQVPVIDIIYEILITYCGIDPSFIDYLSWVTFSTEYLQDYIYSRLISEPIGVTDLLDEICQSNIILWWDSRSRQIKIDTLRARVDSSVPIWGDDDSILENSFTQGEERNSRVSQLWFHYGLRNPVVDVNRLVNYASVEIIVDNDAESEYEYSSPAVLKLFNQWLPAPLGSFVINLSRAQAIAARYISWTRDTKNVIVVSVDAKDTLNVWTGDVVDINTRYLQDFNGYNLITRFLVTEVKESLDNAGNLYTYKLISTGVTRGQQRIGLITPNEDPDNVLDPFPDYTYADASLRDTYAFISNNNLLPTMPNGDPPYLIL